MEQVSPGGVTRFPQKYNLQIQSAEDLDKVHQASLDILERAGISTNSKRLMQIMADHGQRVDFDKERIYFDPQYVEEMIALAPSGFTLGARNPDNDLVIDGRFAYLSTDGCPAEIIDLDTGQRRYSTKEDLRQLGLLADYLPEIGFHFIAISANDKPVAVRPLHEAHALFPVTGKHIMQMTAYDNFNARALVEMCEAIQGADELRKRPIMSNFQCVISPLHWESGPIDALETFGKAGIPAGICSMPLMAATSPASVAGTVTLANAEILSGIVIQETLVPGARTFYVQYASGIDMGSGSMNQAWAGEELLMETAGAAMARRYGIPTICSTMGHGAMTSDWQGGVQNTFSAMTSLTTSCDLLTGVGSYYNASVYSLAAMVLDAEIMKIGRRWLEGIDFSDEQLAVNVVEDVINNQTGHFLGEQHTRDHMRDFYRTDLMYTGTWEQWEADGRPTPLDAATAKVRDVLATWEPMPLEEDLRKELDAILERYEAEAGEEYGAD
jgi:trimethylamine--corrinoid protein Co-methyltransferase